MYSRHSFFSSLIITAFIIAGSAFLTSCATIINSDKQEVSVNSNPANARIFVDGIEVGSTPAILRLKRGDKHIIEIQKEGYITARIKTRKNLSGWCFGNLICGGLIGAIVDLATGSAYQISPDTINITLERDDSTMNLETGQDIKNIHIQDEKGNSLGDITINWN